MNSFSKQSKKSRSRQTLKIVKDLQPTAKLRVENKSNLMSLLLDMPMCGLVALSSPIVVIHLRNTQLLGCHRPHGNLTIAGQFYSTWGTRIGRNIPPSNDTSNCS